MSDLTPLGHAYEDFIDAITALRHRDRALSRAAREVCYWLDRALGPLDDLYGGDDAMLAACAAYEHADHEQRRLACDAYRWTSSFLARARAAGHATVTRTTAALLVHLTPFVSLADHRRFAVRDYVAARAIAR